ncbi:MAG TPA: efflux RND transporter periplasmic adaptor subunit [Verrucomicrobiae bacterium]|nr:efflux RND transporter periplasmic adaptor subunit [Verrucomicrobiae bacterium]
MNRRMLQMLGTFVLVVAILGFVKYRQISAAIAANKSFAPPPEAVTTVVAQQVEWSNTLDAVGSIAPVQGVTLSADLPGVVAKVAFNSGARVAEGQVLVQLDTRQEQAQLASAQAQLDLAKVNLDRAQKLFDQKAIAQSDFDLANAQYKSAEAAVGQAQASIDRKTIRAPFAGVTGIRQVNLGQYVNSGDAIVTLQAMDAVFMNFSVPQQDFRALTLGSTVDATVEGSKDSVFHGKVTAIDPVVNDATRNVSVQATFPNLRGELKPGMYATVRVVVGEGQPIVSLPSSAINYAPYGNSVFILEDMKGPDGKTYRGVRQQFVKLGRAMGDQVAILGGVKAGDEVATSGVFKLRPNAAVKVNNTVMPSDSTAPKPADS